MDNQQSSKQKEPQDSSQKQQQIDNLQKSTDKQNNNDAALVSQQEEINKKELEKLTQFVYWVDQMRVQADIQLIKTKIIFGILDHLNQIKRLLKSDKIDKAAKKQIKNTCKQLFTQNDGELFVKFRKLILQREKDRSFREQCIRAVKRILKISKKICQVVKLRKLHIIICCLIERDFKFKHVEKERMQCFKLIKAWMKKDPSTFPILFAQALHSIARNNEDYQLRFEALGAMIDLCNRIPNIGAHVGGIKLLIDSLLDTTLQGFRYDRISHALVLLINDPNIRIYFRHFIDLNRIFSIFTQPDGIDKDPKKEALDKLQQQMQLAKKSIVNMMRSWQGVIYLTSSPLGLTSLVQALNQPIHLYKKTAILDTFIEIFNVPIFIGGNEGSQSKNSAFFTDGSQMSDNLLTNYVALLLQAFHHCGAYDALTKLGTTTEESSDLNEQSKFLLKKIMYLSSYLLPDVPHFPSLIQLATEFTNDAEATRTRATKLVKELSTVALKNPLEVQSANEILGGGQKLTIMEFSPLFMNVFEYFNQMKLGLPNNQVISNYLVDLKTYYYSEIDELKFKNKIQLTRITQEKNWRKWNWEVILEIVEGNLLTTARLEEILRKTKWIKRLLNFYLPSKQQFITLPWKEENFIYAQTGYHLIKRLLSDRSGRKTLSSHAGVFLVMGFTFVENKDNIFHHKKSFLQDIQDLFEKEINFLENQKGPIGKRKKQSNMSSDKQQTSNFGNAQQQQINQNDPSSGQGSQSARVTGTGEKVLSAIGATDTQRYFTKTRINETMLRELLSWLGLFSNSKEGIQLLTKFKVFEHLEMLVDHNGYNDHVCQIVLQCFDFGFESPCRPMLKIWALRSSPNLAKSIIEYCRMLHRQGLNDFYDWCLPFLYQHLALDNQEISAAAFDVLEESCFDEHSLNYLLNQNDNILQMQMGQEREPFIAKFLRSEIGFQLLQDRYNWVTIMLREWKEKGNLEYIARLEHSMYEGLNLNIANSQQQTHAMSIWIPIYDHSNDFRNELMLLKRYPFQVLVKVENMQGQTVAEERLQTYFDISPNNELQIIGKVVRSHSKVQKIPISEMGYISVCVKLGSTYVDSRCKANEVPTWTLSQIDNEVKEKVKNSKQKKVLVLKNGFHFIFQKENQSQAQQQYSLDHIICKVQILPQKYKTIKKPIHFFGELVKTKTGAEYLKQSKNVDLFKQEILSKKTSLLQKRAALWAIGHIGSNQHGIKLVMDASLIPIVVELAEKAEFLSLRGTCIYIIGMLSSTPSGMKEIQKHNWFSSKTKGISNVCLPKEPSKLFNVQDYYFQGSITGNDKVTDAQIALKRQVPLTPEENEVVKQISNLINGVTEMGALNDLRKKMDKQQHLFVNPRVFEHTMMLLSVYKFKPKARKFIFNMFENLIFNDAMDENTYHHL